MRSIPILMYHEISVRPHPSYLKFTVTPTQFGRQMKWLADHGYSTITPADLTAYRARGRLPRKPIVLTFDDGCRECVDHATAILPRHGFTAIFYLVSGSVGATTWWTKERLNTEFEIIDWNTARDLVARGFFCGSHTVSHRRLATLPPAECHEELYRSQATLQDRLGQDIVHLSYPHGSFNEQVRRTAAAVGYQTACTTQPGLSSGAEDAMALRRVGVYGDETFTDFRLRVLTGKRTDELLPRPVYVFGSQVKRVINLLMTPRATG